LEVYNNKQVIKNNDAEFSFETAMVAFLWQKIHCKEYV